MDNFLQKLHISNLSEFLRKLKPPMMLIPFSIDNWGVSEAKNKKIIFKKNILHPIFFRKNWRLMHSQKAFFWRIWSSHGQLFAKIAYLNFSELLRGLKPPMMLILFSIDNWGVSEAKSKKIIFKKIFCTQFFSQKLKVDAFSKSLFGRIWSSHGQLFAKIAFLNFSELLLW